MNDYRKLLEDRLAESLDPDLRERYRKRRADAMKLQDQSFQGPEAAEALADGQRMRALQAGLTKAANKFGSVMGDGGPKSDIDSTMGAFNEADKAEYGLKDSLFRNALAQEDEALGSMASLDSSAVQGLKNLQDYHAQKADNDWLDSPIDDYSKAAGEATLERQGMGGKVPWDRLRQRDLQKNPFLKSVVEKSTAKSEGRPVYQKLRDADGVIRVYAVYADGRKEPVGDAGFAGQVRTDPVTGGLITVDPNRGARGGAGGGGGAAGVSSPAQMPGAAQNSSLGVNTGLLPGESPKQRDARVKLETAREEERIKSAAKADSEVGEAATEQYRVGELTKRVRKLRDGAFFTGPVAGRVGQTLNEFGVSAGQADKLNQALSKELSDYIKATTGAAATESEMKRLEKFIPSSKDTDSLFENKMQGLEENVAAIVNEKLAKKRGRSDGAQGLQSQQQEQQKSSGPKNWRDIKK